MRRRTLLAALLLSAAARPGWAAGPQPVVATFSILADMTATIGGEDVAVTSLVPVNGDAHTYEPVPADLRALQAAVALVENGLGMEGWLERLARASAFHGVTVLASNGVVPRSMEEDGQRITDPHAWQDPRNGVLYARNIADGLARAVPEQADAIRVRAADYIGQIEAVDRWVEQTLSAVPRAKRKIITSHDAFGYYGARYGVTLRAAQGISTEDEPSARDIATLIGQIRRENIKAVFVENMTDPRLIAMLAKESGATVGGTVYSDALSPPGGPADTYLKMFRHNATLFARAMAAN
jgi:zinc/manganese transport system substrate-binding protein